MREIQYGLKNSRNPLEKDANPTPTGTGIEPVAPPIMPESSNLPCSSTSEETLVKPPCKLKKTEQNDFSLVKATDSNSNVDTSNWFGNVT